MSDANSNQEAEDEAQRELEENKKKYAHYVLKPDLVAPLWNHEDPYVLCQNLLNDYIEFKSGEKGRDINEFTENELRYEKN